MQVPSSSVAALSKLLAVESVHPNTESIILIFIISRSEEISQVPHSPSIEIDTLDSIMEGPQENVPLSENGNLRLN